MGARLCNRFGYPRIPPIQRSGSPALPARSMSPYPVCLHPKARSRVRNIARLWVRSGTCHFRAAQVLTRDNPIIVQTSRLESTNPEVYLYGAKDRRPKKGLAAGMQGPPPKSAGAHSQYPHTWGRTSHTMLTEKVIVYKPFKRDMRNRRYGICTIKSRCRR